MSAKSIPGAAAVEASATNGEDAMRLRVDPDRGRHWLLRIRPLWRRHALLSLLVFSFSVGAVVFQTAIPGLLGNAVDAIGASLRAGDAKPLGTALLLLLAGGLARSAMNFSVRYTLFMLTYRIESSLRRLVYRRLMALPLSFLARFRTGQILSRANSDIRTIQNFLLYLPYTLMVFGTFFLSIVYMFAIDVRLALLAISPLPVVFLLSLRLRRLAYPLSWLVQSRMADVASVVDENIRGQSAVKLFGRQAQQIEALKIAAVRLRWASMMMIRYRARYSPWIENIAVLGQIAILLYGGSRVIRGELQLGQLVAFNVYVLMMMTPFNTLGQVLVMARNASAAASRVFALLDEETVVLDDPVEVPDRLQEIVLEGVRYVAPEDPERPDAGRRLVLDGVDANLRAGGITAIVGRTGSGKTTIAQLIVGLIRPEAGRILANGADLSRIEPARLHRDVLLVSQESFLFADTIAANIAFGCPDASEADIVRAATIADAHDFILQQPEGYATQVSEGGGTLSGGQRQRITIAQAVLMRPSVLVLDDATSGLDSVTEAKVIEALKREMRDGVLIIISHRASMVRHAEEVLLLHEGRIADRSTHEALLRDQPLYRDVFVQDDSGSADDGPGPESDAEFRKRIGDSVRGAASFDVRMGELL